MILRPRNQEYEYTYVVERLRKVVDGDTVDLQVTKPFDLGFHVTTVNRYTGRFRLTIVDTPERGEPGYLEATAFTKNWILSYPAPILLMQTYKDPDNFGRYLGDIFRSDTGDSLSSALLEAGYARYSPS